MMGTVYLFHFFLLKKRNVRQMDACQCSVSKNEFFPLLLPSPCRDLHLGWCLTGVCSASRACSRVGRSRVWLGSIKFTIDWSTVSAVKGMACILWVMRLTGSCAPLLFCLQCFLLQLGINFIFSLGQLFLCSRPLRLLQPQIVPLFRDNFLGSRP